MATVTYECLFLFDSNRYARDPGGCSTSIEEAITSRGGEILVSRLWAEQKLAYPIKGHQKGTYWLIYFNLDSLKLTELNRANQLNESLLRWLFTRVDPRLVEPLVAHAKGKSHSPTPDIALESDDDEGSPSGPESETKPKNSRPNNRRELKSRPDTRKNTCNLNEWLYTGCVCSLIPQVPSYGRLSMASFNRVILLGNLTRDIELRYTTTRNGDWRRGNRGQRSPKEPKWRMGDEPTFVDLKFFGRTAEIAGEYLPKDHPSIWKDD